MDISIPLWFAIPFVVWLIGAFFIGKPEEDGMYFGDFMTPMFHVMWFLFMLVVTLFLYIFFGM